VPLVRLLPNRMIKRRIKIGRDKMVGGCRLFRVGKIIKAPLPVGEGDELGSCASVSLWYYCAFLSSVEGDTMGNLLLSISIGIDRIFLIICPKCGGDILYSNRQSVTLPMSTSNYLLPTTDCNLPFG
jgi:hypothetical protein